jgi:hypothetical protein
MFYDIGLSATWNILTFDARWVDTDLSELECFGGLDLCEGGFVGTISVSFGG